MIKCVIFDFDGTLVDSNQIKRKAFFSVTSHLSIYNRIMSDILEDPKIGNRFEIFDCYVKRLNEKYKYIVDSSDLVNEYTLLCEKKIVKATSIKGADKALMVLKKIDVKVVLSSATPFETLNKIIRKRKMSHLFDNIFGSPESKEEHINKVMNIYSLKSNEILYIGDSEIDRKTALISECFFLGVGEDGSRFHKKPQKLVNSLDSIVDVISQFS